MVNKEDITLKFKIGIVKELFRKNLLNEQELEKCIDYLKKGKENTKNEKSRRIL